MKRTSFTIVDVDAKKKIVESIDKQLEELRNSMVDLYDVRKLFGGELSTGITKKGIDKTLKVE